MADLGYVISFFHSQSSFLWFDTYKDANITIQLLVVLYRILNDVKQNQFIEAPIEVDLEVVFNIQAKVNIDSHSGDEKLERPKDLSQWLLEVGGWNW